jgi:arabinogalactan oligomer/maltooligosaccharide transport system permease protein
MLILLFSVMVIMLIIAFLIFYGKNVRLAYQNTRLVAQGKKPSTMKEDIHELLDSKFHITVLSIPTLTAFAFTILPLIFMVLIAFTNFDRSHQPPGSLFTWVGLENFINMFNGSNAFYSNLPKTLFEILKWSLIWAVFATFLNYIFGMVLALMINKKGIHLKKMWRTIFVITIAVPQFISLLVVARILDDAGPIVALLKDLGLVKNNFTFFGNGTSARITVIVVNLWVGVPTPC